MSLTEAARRAYEETETSEIAPYAEMPLPNGGKSVINWYAYALVGKDRDTPIFGKKPPSTVRRQIPADEFKSCSFENDAQALVRYGEKEPQYTELEIRETEFFEAIGRDQIVGW